MKSPPRYILPVIVAAQFAGTSLWFAGNAVMPDIAALWSLPDGALGWVTSSVQLGFITGTLLGAVTMLTDRVSGRVVFLVGALLGALANSIPLVSPGLTTLLFSRFVVGVALAGIYPVGMKLAASWYQAGLSRALGWLVGALVLGTALPHLIRGLGSGLPWSDVLGVVSVLAVLGGVAVAAFVPEGPHVKRSAEFDPRAILSIFGSRDFRSAALGYFGHMWELYAFWALVPALVLTRASASSMGAFTVIALGAVGCVVGGVVALRVGAARVAVVQLALSGTLALTAPIWMRAPTPVALALLAVWGISVVGDSPQLSTLTARTAPKELVGSGLTIVTSLGFAITIASIELTSWLARTWDVRDVMPVLALGPLCGLFASRFILANDPTRVAE